MKKHFLSAVVALCMMTMLTTPALAYSGYAYSIGGEFHNGGEDVQRMADYWAVSGYQSYYNVDPDYDYVADEDRLNSDILYFSSHGNQHGIYLLNDVVVTDGHSNAQYKEVGILDYSLTNNRVVIYDACETAKGSSNLCTATYGQGAAAVIGWPESVLANDSYSWMERFADYASRGYSLNRAMEYADSFSDYSQNSVIKSHKLYGDGTQDIQRNWRSATSVTELEQDARLMTFENAPTSQDDVLTAIQSINPAFDVDEYQMTISENESSGLTVIDYVRKVGDFVTNSGYTVMIRNGVVESVYDNTVQEGPEMCSITQFTVSSEDYVEAEAAARAEIEERGDSVAEIAVKPYLDLATGQRFMVAEVIYYYQNTEAKGGEVFYYNFV